MIWIFKSRFLSKSRWCLRGHIPGVSRCARFQDPSGVIQFAMLIAVDHGHSSPEKTRGKQAQTRRSRHDAWAKKGVTP